MNLIFTLWRVLACGSALPIAACAAATLESLALVENLGQSNPVILAKPKDFNAAAQSFIERKDLAGLEQFARQTYNDWIDADRGGYRNLMVRISRLFHGFPNGGDTAKRLAIEFQELSVSRLAELDILEELRELAYSRQSWDKVSEVWPTEIVAMREANAARMLSAWQRADDAWDQIKDRPVIRPVGTNNIHVPLLLDPAGKPIPVNELPLPESLYRFLREQGLGTGPEVAREYNFRIGLQNELPNYTNAAPQNLASAFSQPPQDLRRLAALTEQHLKKPESRDAFYGVAIRGIPENLRPQFLAVVRETQERRKAHLRTPGAPLIREHTNRPSGSADSRGSNPVPNQTVGKPIPAVKTPILAAASPNPATSEAAPGTPPRSLPYLPLAGVLAAGLVLWWFLSRSRPG